MNGKPDRDDRPASKEKDAKKNGATKSNGDSVSRVLKTVYDDTLREDIPAEFRDLLSKLD